MVSKKFSTPKGYEILNQTEYHIANIGQGFYKRNEAEDLKTEILVELLMGEC